MAIRYLYGVAVGVPDEVEGHVDRPAALAAQERRGIVVRLAGPRQATR